MNRRLAIVALLALTAALPLQAQDQPIGIEGAFARSNGVMGGAGAVFLTMTNAGATDDRLLSVASDAAQMAALHRHSENADGVMSMGEIDGGIALPAGASHALRRGGDHIMLMGLTRVLNEGDTVSVALTFEQAGIITIDVPVDNAQ